MSVCLGYIGGEYIFLAADSRGSKNLNGVGYKVCDDMKKIHRFGKQILFSAGFYEQLKEILAMYKVAQNRTPAVLDNIIREVYSKAPHRSNGGVNVEIGLFEYSNNGMIDVHNWTDKGRDKYMSGNMIRYDSVQVPEGVITIGTNSDNYDLSMVDVSNVDEVVQATSSTFNQLSSELVGGTMTGYILKPNGECIDISMPIEDSRIIRELHLDPKNGLKVTNADGKYVIKLNANPETNNGRQMEIVANNKTVFFFDAEASGTGYTPNLYVNGSIGAKKLFLGNVDIEDMINDSKNVINTNDKGNDAIGGDYINGKGIYVEGEDGKPSFVVDGKGNLTLAGWIRAGGKISTSAGNSIIEIGDGGVYIYENLEADPDKPPIQGELKGKINYDTMGAGTSEEATNRVFFSSTSGNPIKIESGDNMSIGSAGTTFGMGNWQFDGTVKYRGSQLATQSDINAIYDYIDSLHKPSDE